MSKFSELKEMSGKNGPYSKIILGIRMPDGSKKIIINDNVAEKIAYIEKKYDEDLRMNGAPIAIEEFMLVKA